MTIEQYTNIVFDFDDDLTDEEIAQKLKALGVSEEEQNRLAMELVTLLAPNKKTPVIQS